MIALVIAAALACSPLCVSHERETPFPLIKAASVKGYRIVDGDTFAIGDERVRIMGLDAPEMRARCEAERIGAHLAKRRLAELLAGGFGIERQGRDRYGRTLAVVTVAGRDVAEIMVSEGLARKWAGRRESWCHG